MAHKKDKKKKDAAPYTIEDAMHITDDLFALAKEKNYHTGAFIHGLIFALEYATYSFQIPQQQLATIKRDCRRYFKELATHQQQKKV